MGIFSIINTKHIPEKKTFEEKIKMSRNTLLARLRSRHGQNQMKQALMYRRDAL